MDYIISKGAKPSFPVQIELPFSKSISNRLLIAQALSKEEFTINGLSEAEDTKILQAALLTKEKEIDLGMAGTAYRFLTAYFAMQQKECILKGHVRMHERPIGVLVEALKSLGAEISFLEKEGFPPLHIKGKTLSGNLVEVSSDTSSQFISALLLISPYINGGVEINIKGSILSRPYIEMTLQLMSSLGIQWNWKTNIISIQEGNYHSDKEVRVERDWSSAAFYYSAVALGAEAIYLKGLGNNSIQGDQFCIELFEVLGVHTANLEDGLLISRKVDHEFEESLELDLGHCPDLIPPFVVCASQLVKQLRIRGISTLKIKESNRILALKNELQKLGVGLTEIDDQTIEIHQSENSREQRIKVETYNDHRIAMSFAPLVFSGRELVIQDAEVVGKSFPNYWDEFSMLGVHLRPIN